MMLHCVWFFGTNLLSATNAHSRMTVGLLASAGITIALAQVFAHFWGLPGACAAVVVGEAICVGWYLFVGARPSPVSSPAPVFGPVDDLDV